jgi:hypothetical protein
MLKEKKNLLHVKYGSISSSSSSSSSTFTLPAMFRREFNFDFVLSFFKFHCREKGKEGANVCITMTI